MLIQQQNGSLQGQIQEKHWNIFPPGYLYASKASFQGLPYKTWKNREEILSTQLNTKNVTISKNPFHKKPTWWCDQGHQHGIQHGACDGYLSLAIPTSQPYSMSDSATQATNN